METITREAIEQRIAQIVAEREQFIAQATAEVNARIAAYNGAEAELKRLLAPAAPETEG